MCCEEWKDATDSGEVWETIGNGWRIGPVDRCAVVARFCPFCGSPAGEEPKPSALEKAFEDVRARGPKYPKRRRFDEALTVIREHAKRPSRGEVEREIKVAHCELHRAGMNMCPDDVMRALDRLGVFGPEKRPRCGNPLGPNGLKCDLPSGHYEWHKSGQHEQRWQRGM